MSAAEPSVAEIAVHRRASVVAVGERVATVSEPPVTAKPTPPAPRVTLACESPIVVSVALERPVTPPRFVPVTVDFVSEKSVVPETIPKRSTVAPVPEIESDTFPPMSTGWSVPPASVTTRPGNTVDQSSALSPTPAAEFVSTVSVPTERVTPGMPVSEAPLRLPSIAVHVREPPSVRYARTNEPPVTWKPMPPAPTKTFDTVTASVVSVPLASVPFEPPRSTPVTVFVENAKPIVPETIPKRSTVAVPVTSKTLSV